MVKSLMITLRRSFAGTRNNHVATLKALGFSYRLQTVVQPNNASIRGAVDTVRPLPAAAVPLMTFCRQQRQEPNPFYCPSSRYMEMRVPLNAG